MLWLLPLGDTWILLTTMSATSELPVIVHRFLQLCNALDESHADLPNQPKSDVSR
jgi:hypothetical protein